MSVHCNRCKEPMLAPTDSTPRLVLHFGIGDDCYNMELAISPSLGPEITGELATAALNRLVEIKKEEASKQV